MNFFPARAVVDLAAIRSNVTELAGRAEGAQVMAVVKADAYGHGLLPAAGAALAAGATWLGVAQPAEALALRAGGVQSRVFTWLYAPGAPLAELVRADVDVSVAAGWALEAVALAVREAGRPARVHVKVDTGLGRNGQDPEHLEPLLRRAVELQHDGLLRVVGIWSHLAFADEPGHPSIAAQADVFDAAVVTAERLGCALEVRHLANSAAVLTDPRLHYDLVRPGLAVYGLSPVPQLGGPEAFGLRPAMTLEAQLATVKDLAAGHGVSYAHAYHTPQDTTVGVVPIGYADGVPRHASGGTAGPGGPVRVGAGSRARTLRVAGRVCMDQFVLDLGPGATEQAGDTVTLFGDPRRGVPTAEDWAQAAGTISYEIPTRLGVRVPRSYVGQDAS
ncbi:MAG: alanine racemase [Cellulomonadaceae bacterium]